MQGFKLRSVIEKNPRGLGGGKNMFFSKNLNENTGSSSSVEKRE